MGGSGSGSTFLRLPFRRRRRGRYVAHVALRFAVFVAIVWRACCGWVTHVHACGGYGFSVCLVLLGVALLALSCLLLFSSAPLSLPLSASVIGKSDNLTA